MKKVLMEQWNQLRSPDKWLPKLEQLLTHVHIVRFMYLFCGIGVFLNLLSPFPHFFLFSVAFVCIGALALKSTIYFTQELKTILAALAGQNPATRANGQYRLHHCESCLYILLPLAVILVFGFGAYSMFGALQWTPTFVWMLILFFFTVYISIIGYLQYVVLAIYIYNLANAETSALYHGLPKSGEICLPNEVEWLQKLTKLSHIYRNRFFTLGCGYILSFSAFCVLPAMQANTKSFFFYLLWSIIILAIVILFPVVSFLEYHWIKKILGRVKNSYLKELQQECNIRNPKNPALVGTILSIYALQIKNSNMYPLKSLWADVYALFMFLLNLLASVMTVVQGISTV